MSEVQLVRENPDATGFNLWRRETPGATGWAKSARPDAENKYFMFSADCHINEPADFMKGIEPKFRDRTPRTETRDDGSQWLITEGNRPQRVRQPTSKHVADSGFAEGVGIAALAPLDEEDRLRNSSARSIEQRLEDERLDGVDCELMFPNRGSLCFATPDPVFAMAMCRQWNRWAHEACGEHMQGDAPRILPGALIAAGDLDGAMREVEWAARNGFRALSMGNSPVYGQKKHGNPEYNDPSFEPLWSLIEETGLVVAFHVSTGRDPRAVGGNGGAIINYICHSMETTIEPIVQMIASGVFHRHPKLHAGMVESGVGFIPWLIEAADLATRAHHFWVQPKLPELPSTYFRENCFSSFQHDTAGLRLVEAYGLENNFLWGNDYPHHEGSWPHSAQSIERMMGGLSEETRAKLLGENAARLFGLDPRKYRRQMSSDTSKAA